MMGGSKRIWWGREEGEDRKISKKEREGGRRRDE
jgi:hypothetical protein